MVHSVSRTLAFIVTFSIYSFHGCGFPPFQSGESKNTASPVSITVHAFSFAFSTIDFQPNHPHDVYLQTSFICRLHHSCRTLEITSATPTSRFLNTHDRGSCPVPHAIDIQLITALHLPRLNFEGRCTIAVSPNARSIVHLTLDRRLGLDIYRF